MVVYIKCRQLLLPRPELLGVGRLLYNAICDGRVSFANLQYEPIWSKRAGMKYARYVNGN